MKFFYKIITLWVIIGILSINIHAQLDNHFSDPVAYKYGDNYQFSIDVVAEIDGVLRYLGFGDSNYITFPVQDAKTIVDTETTTPETYFYQYALNSDIPYGATKTEDFIYVAGIGSFFKFEYGKDGSSTLVINNGRYTIPSGGAVSYGKMVFILGSEISVNGQPVLLIYDEAKGGAFTDIDTDFERLELPTGIETVYSIKIDSSKGVIFIGCDNSKVVIYDIASNSFIATYTPTDANLRVDAMTLDTQRTILYSCTYTQNGAIAVISINYEDPTDPVLISKVSIEGEGCVAGQVDMEAGQVFFITETSGGTQLIGFSPDGSNQNSLTNPIDSGGPISMYVNSSNSEIILFFEDALYTLNYQNTCPLSCSNRGNCNYGVCECAPHFTGDGCELALCDTAELNNCTSPSNGVCNDGSCSCTSSFSGLDCSIKICPYNCNQRGTCLTGNFTCVCDEGFEGEACESQSKCPALTSSKRCVARADCGWCEVDGVCVEGDKFGPKEGFCRTWFFDQDVEIGVIALAIIFICCIGILYIIDIATTIPIDIRRSKDYKEEYKSGQHPKATHEEASILWWRDQRSHKAWTLMDQFQFIALVSHIGVVFPGRFISFTEYLDWSNLGIPFPPAINPPQVWTGESTPTRSILSMAQYENSLGSGDLYLLPNILFWFGLLCAAFLVPLLITLLVVSFIEKLIHWKEVITNRLIHVTIRILSFGYIGILLAASFAMVTPLNDYRIIIPGAIIFVLYGIGLPVAIWFLLNVPEARLHHPTFKQQFGCLYVHFKPKTDHRFAVFMFIKRFIMAVIVGILAFKPLSAQPLTNTDLAVPIVQVIVIDAALIGYAVLLFIRKPFFDHYQLWLEYLLAAINVVTCSLSLTHIKSPSAAGELIACLIQAIALIAVIASYIISWLQMRSKFLKKIQGFFSCCKKEDQTIEMKG
ncbi:hypothetical protein DICPUDRAFT_158929 [Dictyostelium purpureum]|uniref:EGF-like domain-containing protein n=1 Tax=Dictyostelium purpureum TaxID=5786 RepID=F1A2U9_DICPU|nr:uncharacterized protein DICPUDRAFT_158929 [Dictyostelium purpureum]EGC29488.1 hypothetical protein DICPUDRAFT_158929 [Dictyostelium purpureum]|eukprot:XP_003293997.1 hypothetical protein DICPUDRAFT_158929 [Dictyostelium purpureum]